MTLPSSHICLKRETALGQLWLHRCYNIGFPIKPTATLLEPVRLRCRRKCAGSCLETVATVSGSDPPCSCCSSVMFLTPAHDLLKIKAAFCHISTGFLSTQCRINNNKMNFHYCQTPLSWARLGKKNNSSSSSSL